MKHVSVTKIINTFQQHYMFKIHLPSSHLKLYMLLETVNNFNFLLCLSLYTCSFKPQPLLQPHISHQLPSTCPAPSRRCALGLLVPVYGPGGFLLPAARCVWTLLLASPRHSLRPILPLHPAEVWGWPWARSAPVVLHHGRVLHDRPCGSILAPWRWGGFTGRENRPPGHSDQAAQYQAESCNRHHWTHRRPVGTF